MAVQEDLGFLGFVTLGDTLRLGLQCRAAATGIPTAPDAAPTWAIYEMSPSGSDTAKLTGSLGASDADSKTGYRRGDAAITAGNGFVAGGLYQVRFFYEISSADRAPMGTFQVV